MRGEVQSVLFAVLVASTLAAVTPVPIYNVTTGLQDYTLLVGRQMDIDIDVGQLQIASVKARHADRIESVGNQQQLVLQEIQQFDNHLLQEQAFSLNRKHCVQKYKPRVFTVKQASQNFTNCLSDAEVSAQHLTRNAEASLRSASIVRENEVPSIFPYCNQTYNTQELQENCVTVRVDLKVKSFNQYIEILQVSLRESLYTSSVIAAEATRCSFDVEKKVLIANGGVSDLVDVCVQDLKKNGASTPFIENGNVIESKLMQRLMSGKNSVQ